MITRTTDNRRESSGLYFPALVGRLLIFLMLVMMEGAHAQESVQSPGNESAVHAGNQSSAPPTEPLTAVRAAVQSYIKELLAHSSGESTVTVQLLDPRLRLARCASALTAALPGGTNLQARLTVGVTCPGPVRWTVYVPVTIETRIDVLVLRHAVARDERLTAADVVVETRKTSGPGAAYLTSVAELGGRTVRRPLAAGTTLAVEMFTPDLIVHRGQTVTLLSSGGAIEVRASGRAMTDAAAGSRVQVQNLSSMRIVEGVVETSDLVRVAR